MTTMHTHPAGQPAIATATVRADRLNRGGADGHAGRDGGWLKAMEKAQIDQWFSGFEAGHGQAGAEPISAGSAPMTRAHSGHRGFAGAFSSGPQPRFYRATMLDPAGAPAPYREAFTTGTTGSIPGLADIAPAVGSPVPGSATGTTNRDAGVGTANPVSQATTPVVAAMPAATATVAGTADPEAYESGMESGFQSALPVGGTVAGRHVDRANGSPLSDRPRIHLWRGDGQLRAWLGISGRSADIERQSQVLTAALARLAIAHGERLVSVVCNGRITWRADRVSSTGHPVGTPVSSPTDSSILSSTDPSICSSTVSSIDPSTDPSVCPSTASSIESSTNLSVGSSTVSSIDPPTFFYTAEETSWQSA
jgi:hypothetical protein